jgi:hypothetical protein
MIKIGKQKKKLKAERKKKTSATALGYIKPDYFARFRFGFDELKRFLRSVSGELYADLPFVFQCLDDLGHWSYVRQSERFEFSSELEQVLRDQFEFLSRSFDYTPGKTVLWGNIRQLGSPKFQVNIVEKLIEGEQELFRVEVVDSNATILVSRYELDFWNAPGSSLPLDQMVVSVDWNADAFWLKKLTNFKEAMAREGFAFNFAVDGMAMREQQEGLFSKLEKFFALTEGELIQNSRGLGYLSCGNGTSDQNALVMAFVLQALGQPFGINARLWGTTGYSGPSPVFLVKGFLGCSNEGKHSEIFLAKNSGCRPIQRPMSEVLRMVVASVGPFGRPEADSVTIRGVFNAPDEHDEAVAQVPITTI